MNRLLAVALLSLLLAPARWGIALNHTDKTCGGYWGGDEYSTYRLPAGWTAYYPDANDAIHTEAGVCQWNRADYKQGAVDCCRALGYAYTANNVGVSVPTGFSVLAVGVVAFVIFLAALGLGALAALVLLVLGLARVLTGRSFWPWQRRR